MSQYTTRPLDTGTSDKEWLIAEVLAADQPDHGPASRR
jgi:hypothetical protein